MREKEKAWEPTPGPRRLAPKWVALLVGTCVAIPGLWGVVANVPLFDKFATRSWTEVREGPGYYIDPSRLVRSSDTQHVLRYDGFEPGTTALFCMLCFTVGVGISACRFLEVTGRQNLWLFMGVAWHVLGIVALVAYVRLAPRPFDAWPLIAISVYEWCGLFLIALGTRKHWFAGKLHDAAWNLWVGSGLWGVAGAIVGALIDFVRFGILKESAVGGFAVPGWIYGGLLGGVVFGMAFVVYHCWKPNPQT